MEDVLPLGSLETVAQATTEIVVASAWGAIGAHDRFTLALGTGPTLDRVAALLAEPQNAERMPWERTVLLFTDERCVAPDAPTSCFGRVRRSLLDPLAGPGPAVWRMQGELDHPARAALCYEQELRDLFPSEPVPSIDLVLLELDAEGGVAGLAPGSALLAEGQRLCAACYLEPPGEWRLTLTTPLLRSARLSLVTASGTDKARVVAEAFGDLPHPEPHPCELAVPGRGRRQVLLDPAAAALLPVGAKSGS